MCDKTIKLSIAHNENCEHLEHQEMPLDTKTEITYLIHYK